MRQFWLLIFSIPLWGQGVIPGRYIVELSDDPVATHAGARRVSALHSAAAEAQRIQVRGQQAGVRASVESRQGVVLGQVENVSNALLVRIPDAQAAALASIPGVARVHPVRSFQLLLDHALAVHRAYDAWNQIGASNAGAGIRIGFIDTGIDVSHPGFSDASFAAPAGFPMADSVADFAYTNNKVIVARSYAKLFASPDPDPSAADHVGHGTATAMAAAGVMNSGPLATISGVAPRAWVGSYKVFGTPGINDSASEDAILQAIEDAVTDGMNIISMSLGSNVAERLEFDPEVQAIAAAKSLGVIVVVSAGNNGNNPNTIASPGDAPAAIAVGATNNNRMFAGTVLLPGANALVAMPAAGSNSSTTLAGPLMDVSPLDGSGLACASLPANSLSGAIALVFRGTCTFEIKLDNAQAAGAIGAVVYDNVPGEFPITMAIGAATLPAEMVSNADGLALKSQLSGAPAGFAVTLQFALTPAAINPASVAAFSAQGPNVDFSIKPDLLAVGENLYTAVQRLDSTGALYDPSGYSVVQGTSFSAPLVAGAAAILEQARPGLTVDQYRSLLVNAADPASVVPGTPATIQQAGGGVLDVLASLNSTAAVNPVSLSFGEGGSAVNVSQTVTLTNVGAVSDTFQLSVTPTQSGGPAPQLPAPSVQLGPGASVSIPVVFQTGTLAPGAYDGYIGIQGTLSSYASRIPFWYAVPSLTPAYITVLYNVGSGSAPSAGSRISQAVVFRVTDAAGLPVPGLQPSVTAMSSGAQALAVSSIDGSIPGAYSMGVRLSSLPGANVFQIQAGTISASVTIPGQ
jgi:minor extracellular serine protease Vpr